MAFEIEWETESGETRTIDFDCAFHEQYESPAEITEHRVEQGASITDHVRAGNDTFSVEAWATNTPIVAKVFGLDGAAGSTRSATIDLGGGKSAGVNVFQHSQEFNRATAIDEQLVALRDAGQILTVRTSLRETGDVVIASYKVTREAETGNCLALTIDFRRVRFATTERVAVQAPNPAQRRGQRGGNRGNQSAQQRDNRSAAARGVDAISSIFGGGS